MVARRWVATAFAAFVATAALGVVPVPAEAQAGTYQYVAVGMANNGLPSPPPATAAAYANGGTSGVTVSATPCGGVAGIPVTVGPGASLAAPFAIPNQNGGSGLGPSGVVRIDSSGPIGAFQVNAPREEQYSSDASWLLPRSLWGMDYVVTTPANGAYSTTWTEVTVVALEDVDVTIRPTADTQTGPGLPGLAAGAPYTFHMTPCTGAFFVTTDSPGVLTTPNPDLSGTRVTATAPVAVFEGTGCTTSTGACDHLEEQAWPVSAWGMEYVVCKVPVPATSPDHLRIHSLYSGSTLVTVGSQSQSLGPPGSGTDMWDVSMPGSVRITSSRPVSVVHVLDGTSGNPSEDPGQAWSDPAMEQVLPVEAWASSAVLHSFDGGWRAQELTIAAPASSSVTVDGAVQGSGTTPAGGGAYRCHDAALGTGFHRVTAPGTAFVSFSAMDGASSYMAPAAQPVVWPGPWTPPPIGVDFTVAATYRCTSVDVAVQAFTDPEDDALVLPEFHFDAATTAAGTDATHTYTTEGTKTIVFTATDSQVLPHTVTYTFEARFRSPCPPTIDAMPPAIVGPGELVHRCTLGHAGVGGALAYTATDLPPGARFTLTAEGPCIDWVPSELQQGNWPCLRVTVTETPGALQDSACLRVYVTPEYGTMPDRDLDSIEDAADNCPGLANRDQADRDADGIGDACEAVGPDGKDVAGFGSAQAVADDADNDGIANAADDCPSTPDPDQADLDHDGLGDPCDDDADGDGIRNAGTTGLLLDDCPTVFDPGQGDRDGDGVGDACDPTPGPAPSGAGADAAAGGHAAGQATPASAGAALGTPVILATTAIAAALAAVWALRRTKRKG